MGKTVMGIKKENGKEPDGKEQRVAYLCDGEVEGCKKRMCYKSGGNCRHTKDINHAIHYEKKGKSFYERKPGYRRDELPTDEEVKNIVKFFYGMTEEQYKDIKETMRSKGKQYKRTIAVLTAINTAIGMMVLKIRNCE